MTTLHMLILCATALGGVGLITRAVLRSLEHDAERKTLEHRLAQERDQRAAAAHERDGLRQRFEQLERELAQDRPTLPGPSLVGRTVAVHTRKPDDQTIRGVLAAHHADRLVLRDAVYAKPNGDMQPAGGTVAVPLLSVSTWQEITPATESG